MRRLLALSLIAASGATQAQGEGGSISLGEVEKRDAMALADRLLAPDIRGRVVEGAVRRQTSPGQVYWIGYREGGRAAGRDLCERVIHTVQLSAPTAPGDNAPPDTLLGVRATKSGKEIAVLAPGQAATDDRCAKAAGYVLNGYEPERRLAAYRVLVAAMAAAARPGTLPFRIDCAADTGDACAGPRKALASLPIDALFGIDIACTEENRVVVDDSTPGVRVTSCRPIEPGQPYNAEFSFDRTGRDGLSWKVSFTHAERWPETIRVLRTMVIPH